MDIMSVPEFNKIIEKDFLIYTKDNFRKTLKRQIWACENCGTPYYPKYGVRTKCDYCGEILKI